MNSNEYAKFLLEFSDSKVDQYRNPGEFDCPCCGKTIPSEHAVRSKHAKIRFCWDCCMDEEDNGGPKPYEEWFQIQEFEKFRASNKRIGAKEVSGCQKTPCTS
jgi:ribosome-binding protein aMBF1 (putative translation factor)